MARMVPNASTGGIASGCGAPLSVGMTSPCSRRLPMDTFRNVLPGRRKGEKGGEGRIRNCHAETYSSPRSAVEHLGANRDPIFPVRGGSAS
jgi:hypothetical protein